MTEADTTRFARAFTALAETFGTDVSPVKIEGYFVALRDVAIDALEAGAAELMRRWKGLKFPNPADWREAAEDASLMDVRRALQAPREEPWRVECPDCEDTGWRWHSCTSATPCNSCRRGHRLYDHNYVTMCPCRATNRTYQRHHLPAMQGVRRDVA